MQPPETITVDSEDIFCDGSTADDGHPRVFLTMTRNGSVECPYCSRMFVLAPNASKAAAH